MLDQPPDLAGDGRGANGTPVCLGVAISLLALVAHATVSSAQPPAPAPEIDLHWEAPAGECPDREELHRRIVSHLSGASASRATGLRVDARIERDAGGMRRLILTIDRAGELRERRLSGVSCEALADAAALLIALSLGAEPASTQPVDVDGSEAGASTSVEDRSTSAGDTPALPSAASDANAAAEEDGRLDTAESADDDAGEATDSPRFVGPDGGERGLMLELGPLAGLVFGALPASPAGGLGMRADLTWWSLGFSAALLWLPEQAATIAVAGGGEVAAGALLGVARGCMGSRGDGAQLGLCAQLELGELSARARGIAEPASGDAGWVALGGALQAGVPLVGRLSALVDLSLVAPLRRPRLLVDDPGGAFPVFTSGQVAARVELAVLYRIF